MTMPIAGDPSNAIASLLGTGVDQAVQAWVSTVAVVLFPEHVGWPGRALPYTRFFDGVPPGWLQPPGFVRHPGWVSWLSDPDQRVGLSAGPALFSSDGGFTARAGRYRGLLGAGDPSLGQLGGVGDSGNSGGETVYRQDLSSGALDLVNACTGTGPDETLHPDATEIPERTVAGRLSSQSCVADQLTSLRGATVGAGSRPGANVVGGPAANGISSNGRRVFFMSPDPGISAAPAACAAGTLTDTDCPPQLYVRQYDSDGNATVRWISRPLRWDLDDPDDQPAIAALGRGAVFEGASADGSRVFFRTNAPLTANDLNGGASTTGATATASNSSWDLYQYTLPQSLDADPATGTLVRITAGPSGAADPNTNCSAATGTLLCTAPNGAALRFVSEQGTKAYFVTAAPIGAGGDVWNAPPANSKATNVPAGAPVNAATRNLYLYDSSKTGADRWKFVARLPFATSGLEGCASAYARHGQPLVGRANEALGGSLEAGGSNCVFGSVDGSVITFMTSAQLTSDDDDSAHDVYVYDAGADRLTRVSAPVHGAGDESYTCVTTGAVQCNADLGLAAFISGLEELSRGASRPATYERVIGRRGVLRIPPPARRRRRQRRPDGRLSVEGRRVVADLPGHLRRPRLLQWS